MEDRMKELVIKLLQARGLNRQEIEQALQELEPNTSFPDIGSRVGVLLNDDGTSVQFVGFGVLAGLENPPAGIEGPEGIPHPKIILDNGDVVYGFEVGWGLESEVQEFLALRKVIPITIERVRLEAALRANAALN